MTNARRKLAERDQAVSAFSAALARLLDATGAVAAALVDREGETVDYAGALSPYEIRIAAAECRLVMQFLHASSVPTCALTSEIVVRAQRRSFFLVHVGEGYALMVALPRYCFRLSTRALTEAVRAVSVEAGFDVVPAFASERWARVEVTISRHDRRPSQLWHEGRWHPLVVLGRYREAGLGRRELGYRVRSESGAEFALVRESLGIWYADSPT